MASSSSGGAETFPALAPEARADAATKRILRHLLAVLEHNQAVFLRGGDGEALHDLRVAVRRTRCALSQIKLVFPAPRVRRFATGFAALGRASSAARDLEVYVRSFGDQAQALPEPLRQALAPIQALLAQRHEQELHNLRAYLQSAAHRRLLADWRAFLDAPVPNRSRLAHAAQPVASIAGRRIWKTYRKVVAEGRAIDAHSPPQALHELRKACKKLRYLLEFFHSLYPARQHQRLVRALKTLQDELGAYQDCQVQAATLLQLAGQSAPPGADAVTFMAMGALFQRLEDQAGLARCRSLRRYGEFAAAKVRHRFAALFSAEDG